MTTSSIDIDRTQHSIVYTDALRSGLQIVRETTEFKDVPGGSETVLNVRNLGKSNSPVICGINVLETKVATGFEPILHTFNGSFASSRDYQSGQRRLDVVAPSNLPWKPGENMHGSAGTLSMAEGFRLWTASATQYQNMTEQGCVALCNNMTASNCVGVTFSHGHSSGINACFVIHPPILRWDAEDGYASWTKAAPPPSQQDPDSFGPRAGRSSDPDLPYFAVAGKSSALVASIGWSGNWRATVSWDTQDSRAIVQVGHPPALLCTYLEPGESIRTMAVTTVSVNDTETKLLAKTSSQKSGDSAAGLARTGFNRHRKLMLNHHLPRDPRTGQIRGSIISSWSWINWPNVSEELQMWHVKAVKSSSVEYFWLDAGYFNGGFPNGVGNWQIPLSNTINKNLFPDATIAGLGSLAHSSPDPVGFITWFEPERVAQGTYIHQTFPEYLLSIEDSAEYLLDLGNPEARQFIGDYLSSAVTQYGLDVLRIDYNIDPQPFWSNTDKANRTGISENRYILGLYELWDRMLHSHPGLLIDDCSSGGRRIDVETLSRSYPLWRSDYDGRNDPVSHQTMTIGLSQFAPVSAGAVFGSDPYLWRSAGVVGKTISWGLDGWQEILGSADKLVELKKAVSETQGLRDVALRGDLYPLTPTATLTSWAAYQYDAGDEGFAYFFRNGNCTQANMTSSLQSLKPVGMYSVTTFTTYDADGPTMKMSGTDLASKTISLPVSASMLLKYQLL